jgi:hypothetical protein
MLNASDEEKKEIDEFARELVTMILSHVHFDKQYEGKALQFFQRYDESAVTDEHLTAIRRSPLWESLNRYLRNWKSRPQPKDDLPLALEFFKTLCLATNSPYRCLANLEKDGRKVDDLTLLRKVTFLTPGGYKGASKTLYFDTDGVAEALSAYLDTDVHWEEMEREVLCLLIRRIFEEEQAKHSKPTAEVFIEWWGAKDLPLSVGVVLSLVIGLAAWLIPRMIGIGIVASVLIAIGLWSMDHLHAGWFTYLALLGLGWVVTGVISWGVYLGTADIRNRLQSIARPSEADDKTACLLELRALEQMVNAYRTSHINLRFVRDLLARCISQGVKVPAQMLTLIDRSIAAGRHYW